MPLEFKPFNFQYTKCIDKLSRIGIFRSMNKLETITNFFVAQINCNWQLPCEVIETINELTPPERRELRDRLFHEARIIAHKKNEDFFLWLQECFRQIDAHTFRFHQVYFSPGYEILDNLRDLINETKKTLDICVFSITDERLSLAISRAIQRDVKVRIITDDMKTFDTNSQIDWLNQKGVEIKTDQADSHMHNKFGIIDNRMIFTGSFNWTKTATRMNQENLLVTSNYEIVQQYHDEFEVLWNEMIDYSTLLTEFQDELKKDE